MISATPPSDWELGALVVDGILRTLTRKEEYGGRRDFEKECASVWELLHAKREDGIWQAVRKETLNLAEQAVVTLTRKLQICWFEKVVYALKEADAEEPNHQNGKLLQKLESRMDGGSIPKSEPMPCGANGIRAIVCCPNGQGSRASMEGSVEDQGSPPVAAEGRGQAGPAPAEAEAEAEAGAAVEEGRQGHGDKGGFDAEAWLEVRGKKSAGRVLLLRKGVGGNRRLRIHFNGRKMATFSRKNRRCAYLCFEAGNWKLASDEERASLRARELRSQHLAALESLPFDHFWKLLRARGTHTDNWRGWVVKNLELHCEGLDEDTGAGKEVEVLGSALDNKLMLPPCSLGADDGQAALSSVPKLSTVDVACSSKADGRQGALSSVPSSRAKDVPAGGAEESPVAAANGPSKGKEGPMPSHAHARADGAGGGMPLGGERAWYKRFNGGFKCVFHGKSIGTMKSERMAVLCTEAANWMLQDDAERTASQLRELREPHLPALQALSLVDLEALFLAEGDKTKTWRAWVSKNLRQHGEPLEESTGLGSRRALELKACQGAANDDAGPREPMSTAAGADKGGDTAETAARQEVAGGVCESQRVRDVSNPKACLDTVSRTGQGTTPPQELPSHPRPRAGRGGEGKGASQMALTGESMGRSKPSDDNHAADGSGTDVPAPEAEQRQRVKKTRKQPPQGFPSSGEGKKSKHDVAADAAEDVGSVHGQALLVRGQDLKSSALPVQVKYEP